LSTVIGEHIACFLVSSFLSPCNTFANCCFVPLSRVLLVPLG